MRSLHVINGVLLISLLFGKGDAACSETNPCVEELGQGQPFQEPDQIDTTLLPNITLNVNIIEIQFGWLKLKRRVYNGKVTGPTWNVRKGQSINLTVNNHLSSLNNDQNKAENEMNKPNTTNIHTHGLHISSNSPQDNVGINIEPGQKYVYKYRLHKEQPSGTYWYHAHVHGSTMFQVQSGMSGLLLVKDDSWTLKYKLKEASCPYDCDADIQMVIQGLLQFNNRFTSFGALQNIIGDDPIFRQDNIIVTGQGITLTQWLGANVNLMTVNGLLQPVLTLKEGKMYRFRMCNTAGFDTLELLITNKGTNQSAGGCEIREIAYDGIYLEKPREPHQGQSFLSPGNRVDWMVKCNTPGEYELRSYADPNNTMSIGDIFRWSGLLVSIKVESNGKEKKRRTYYLDQLAQQLEEAEKNEDNDIKNFLDIFKISSSHYAGWHNEQTRKQPSVVYSSHLWPRRTSNDFDIDLPKRPSFLRDLRQCMENNIKERFVMEFNTRVQMNREHWSTPDDFRYAMTVNTIQEWDLVNTDNVNSHPLHLHINSFQIISYNNYTGPFSIRFEDDYVLYNQDDSKPCHYQRAGLSAVVQEPIPTDSLRFLGHDERYRQNAGNTLGYVKVGDWRDTLLVPPLANITIRFIPDSYTGTCIIHCHLLAHEDSGMMMVTKIVEKGRKKSCSSALSLRKIKKTRVIPSKPGIKLSITSLRAPHYHVTSSPGVCCVHPIPNQIPITDAKDKNA